MSRAHVALGSNLSSPRIQIARAFDALEALPGTRLLARSSLYLSAPISEIPQPDYVNAAALLETSLSPLDLLDALFAIEACFGRVRSLPNAPRTLDLDLLLYDDRMFSDDRLKIPHPRMHERLFVLLPLLEIDPDCEIPGIGRAADLIGALGNQTIAKVTPC